MLVEEWSDWDGWIVGWRRNDGALRVGWSQWWYGECGSSGGGRGGNCVVVMKVILVYINIFYS